jgi:hypothetical protein
MYDRHDHPEIEREARATAEDVRRDLLREITLLRSDLAAEREARRIGDAELTEALDGHGHAERREGLARKDDPPV